MSAGFLTGALHRGARRWRAVGALHAGARCTDWGIEHHECSLVSRDCPAVDSVPLHRPQRNGVRSELLSQLAEPVP